MADVIGRHRGQFTLDERPEDVQAGDYWQLVADDGTPLRSSEPSNLTGTCWVLVAPLDGGGYAVGHAMKHTVREEEDGTISIRQNDGSSNSVLITGSRGRTWHGYIEHGVWRSA